MSGRLNTNSMPAERERGCIFAEQFESEAEVIANGGTVTSAPVINFGASFDGTDDKIEYPKEGDVKSVSFRVKLATTTEDVMQLSASHSIEATAGTLTATGFTTPTIYIAGAASTTITTDWVWVVITTGTAFDADNIVVGADDSFGEFEIKDLKFWKVALTAQEAADLANNSTYNYRNKALLDCPMEIAQHDSENFKTLDISKNSYDITFGLGNGGVTTPTKNTKRGYSFDGGDFLDIPLAAWPGTSGSIAIYCNLTDVSSHPRLLGTSHSSGANSSLRTYNSGLGLAVIMPFGTSTQTMTWISEYGLGVNHSLVLTWELVGSDTVIKTYDNGELVHSATKAGVSAVAPNVGFYIGKYGGISLVGNAYSFKTFAFTLTPLQIKDIYISDLNKINNI